MAMTRQEQIKEFGVDFVEATEFYWKQRGYTIDYKNGLLVKIGG